jgi:hypothetical protein
MKKLLFLFLSLSLLSCKQESTEKKIPVEPNNGIGDGAPPPAVLSFSENIEEAHNKVSFMNKKAISFDIVLKFGGEPRLDAGISMTTNSSKVRLDKADGTSIIFDGEEVRITPASAKTEGARFDIFTWQYFFAMPFKLTDPGTIWEDKGVKMIDGKEYKTARLSFTNTIGDSPDDWYIVYQDPETRRLKAAAYIVTFNKEKDKAEKDPHAIVYSEYDTIDGTAIATKWSFHNWSEETGIGKKLGEASITNIKFFEPEQDYFTSAADSKTVGI